MVGPISLLILDSAEYIMLARDDPTRAQLEPAYREYQEVLNELHAIEENVESLASSTMNPGRWGKGARTISGWPSNFAIVTSALLRLACNKVTS